MLRPKKARVVDVQVLDVFDAEVPRIVVAIEGTKAKLINCGTGRISHVAIKNLQRHHRRCSGCDADGSIRYLVRTFPALARQHDLVDGRADRQGQR